MMGSSSDCQNELYLQHYPDPVVRDIVERVNRTPTHKKDNFILRLLCPNVREILSKPMTHLSSLELSRVGGRIRDLKYVPELSSFHVDFANYDGDDIALLKGLKGLNALSVTNIDLRLSPRLKDEVFDVSDESRHRGLEQTQNACSNICLFRFMPFLRGGTTRAPMLAFQFLTGMNALRHLKLDGGTKGCSAILPFVLEVPQLKSLSIDLLNFKGHEVRHLRRLRADLHLTLHGFISKAGFWELHRLPTLTSLTLLHCTLGNFPFHVKRLRALRRLRIQCSTLDDRDFKRLSETGDSYSALEISLFDTDPNTLRRICDMTAPITALSIKMEVLQCERSLRNCTKLEFLNLEVTERPFSGAELLRLVHCTRLRHFHVIGCLDWSPILSSEVLGSSLVSLTIGWSLVQGEHLRELRRLGSLQDLTLSLCPLLDTLSPLKDMSQLKSLTIFQCPLLEEAMEGILLSSLPDGLEQLKLGLSDGQGFETLEDLLVSLNERFPQLKVLPADVNA